MLFVGNIYFISSCLVSFIACTVIIFEVVFFESPFSFRWYMIFVIRFVNFILFNLIDVVLYLVNVLVLNVKRNHVYTLISDITVNFFERMTIGVVFMARTFIGWCFDHFVNGIVFTRMETVVIVCGITESMLDVFTGWSFGYTINDI